MLHFRAVLAPPVKWAFKQFLMHYMYSFFKRVLYAQLTGMNTKSIRWTQIYNCFLKRVLFTQPTMTALLESFQLRGKYMYMSIANKPRWNLLASFSLLSFKLIRLMIFFQPLSLSFSTNKFSKSCPLFSACTITTCKPDESYRMPRLIQVSSTRSSGTLSFSTEERSPTSLNNYMTNLYK